MECDRVFGSASMDILSEQSRGGRTGPEAKTTEFQPRQSGSSRRSRRRSKCFYSVARLMPEVNSEVATITAERHQTNCCPVGANTSGGEVSQWGASSLMWTVTEMKQETMTGLAPCFNCMMSALMSGNAGVHSSRSAHRVPAVPWQKGA